jgi:HEAT repeat protein
MSFGLTVCPGQRRQEDGQSNPNKRSRQRRRTTARQAQYLKASFLKQISYDRQRRPYNFARRALREPACAAGRRMGKALRAKRLSSFLKMTFTQTGREVSGRERIRGPLLLVFLYAAAIGSLAQVPSDVSADAAARLNRQITTGSAEEKRSALFEIRNLRSPSASLIAVPALRDKNELVRATAASSVVFLPKPDAARELVPLLTDRAEFVRREAAHALGEVGDASGTVPLVRLIQSEKILEVRTAAAIALGKIGDPTSIESLLGILRPRPREEDEFLRRSAARSIGQIAQKGLTGDSSVLTPQNFLPDKFKDLGPANDSAGSQPGFSTAVDVLIGVLRNTSESDDTRREAAYSLGAIGDPRAVTVLQAFTSATDPYLAEIAREALLKIQRATR